MGEHTEQRKKIQLSCGHQPYYHLPYPKVGELLTCMDCRRNARVIHAPNEFRISCNNCIFSRRFGNAKVNAEIAASKHRRKYPSHVVGMYTGARLVRTFPRDAGEEPGLF